MYIYIHIYLKFNPQYISTSLESFNISDIYACIWEKIEISLSYIFVIGGFREYLQDLRSLYFLELSRDARTRFFRGLVSQKPPSTLVYIFYMAQPQFSLLQIIKFQLDFVFWIYLNQT